MAERRTTAGAPAPAGRATPDRRPPKVDTGKCCAHCKARTRRRATPRREKEPEALARFAEQMIRLLVRDAFAVAEPSDVLPILAALGRTVDDELHKAVQTLRGPAHGYTWELIGERLGVGRTAAQKRFGHPR